ncbi:hypothetical protein EYC80_010522 [Monilinia laxa]|uniref:Uncharacterized protein n=1 Tax=Monilinia laxa TaxID=61186 RepID=A0A5N6JPQ7_MONLA|nr:hypothetical protein EYC80_010522 [Monilinia laxa]
MVFRQREEEEEEEEEEEGEEQKKQKNNGEKYIESIFYRFEISCLFLLVSTQNYPSSTNFGSLVPVSLDIIVCRPTSNAKKKHYSVETFRLSKLAYLLFFGTRQAHGENVITGSNKFSSVAISRSPCNTKWLRFTYKENLEKFYQKMHLSLLHEASVQNHE